jgi:hypothetical protein
MRSISAAFGVAMTDLLPKSDNPEALSVKERQLIEGLRHASDELRAQFERVAAAMLPASDAPAASGAKSPRKLRRNG